jgi:glucose/arabinose dehydrogenase
VGLRTARLIAAATALVAAVPGEAAVVPAGFADELVTSGVPAPTALAFTPDGRLLVAGQGGTLHVVAGGALQPLPALDLTASTCSDSERGLLGVAVDPAFAVDPYVYMYYTFKKHGVCTRNASNQPVNRVSRFVMAGNAIDAASETVLVDNIPSPNGNHNGGDVQFGTDGFLYISIGDGGCDYAGNSGCAGANDAARDRHVLLGKVLRLTKTGAIPAGNPFQGAGTASCRLAGSATPGVVCSETFAWGLRNPYRIAFDPNTAGTRFFVNDVGQGAWEEIDEGQAGADYGWNVREGPCATGSTTSCGAPPAGMTNPVFAYGHSSGCRSIVGGAFVPAGAWPSAYDGDYLYGDFICGRIFRLEAAPGGFTQSVFADGAGSVVHLAFGRDGLYYTAYPNQVRRIVPATVASASDPATGASSASSTSSFAVAAAPAVADAAASRAAAGLPAAAFPVLACASFVAPTALAAARSATRGGAGRASHEVAGGSPRRTSVHGVVGADDRRAG